MIIAVKDHLEIEVTIKGEKVKIDMPSMEDVMVLWDSWIKQEEILAERFLKARPEINPYPVLVSYFQENGWEIKKTNFSQS